MTDTARGTRAAGTVRGIDSFDAVPLSNAVSDVDACPSTNPNPSAIFFNGFMDFDLGGMQGLSRLMPDVMLVDAEGKRYPGSCRSSRP
ncbi:hypothetical protein GCM10017744_022130 [Streptomyces antimycoticus]